MIRTAFFALILLAASAFAADRAGTYEGTYTSTSSDATGKLRIVVQKNASGWSCQVFFTPDTEEIATKPGACSLDNDRFATEFDAEAGDTGFHATMKGAAIDDRSFEGTYSTAGKGGEAGDQGKWKIALHK